MKYISICLNRKSKTSIDNKWIFENLYFELSRLLHFTINPDNKIFIKILPECEDLSCNSFEEAKAKLEENEVQFIIEFDETKDNLVIAMLDNFFTQTDHNNFYRLDTACLYLHKGKYANEEIVNDRLIASIAYGLLKELSFHNSANKNVFHRGLNLMDYLYRNPPSELYRITKKIISTNKAATILLDKSFCKDISQN